MAKMGATTNLRKGTLRVNPRYFRNNARCLTNLLCTLESNHNPVSISLTRARFHREFTVVLLLVSFAVVISRDSAAGSLWRTLQPLGASPDIT